MSLQFDTLSPGLSRVVHAAAYSLTHLVSDLDARTRHDHPHEAGTDIESWLNALHLQSAPLLTSSTGRANLADWLALVDNEIGQSS